MLYQFVLTPDVFESWAIKEDNREGVIVVELLSGLSENGLLANLHNGRWLTRVRQIQDSDKASPHLRDAINARLSELYDRNRIVRHPRGSSTHDGDDCSWVHWAIERHESEPANRLHGVVATEEQIELSGAENEVLVPLLQALTSSHWRSRRRSVRFTKTDANLRRHLAPLVRYAKVVHLIDPYLSCRKERFFDTVQHCAALLGRRDGQQELGQIRIHAGDPLHDPVEDHREPAANRLDRWEEALQQVVAQNGHTFRVSLWANKPGEKTFHDRYILTDQCGIDARGGLDFAEDATRANISGWTLLEHDEIADILTREFHERKGPYKLLGSREVRP